MNKRRFVISSDFDCCIKIDVDTLVMTPVLAEEIDSFFSGREVLEASNGDHVQAVVRRAARQFFYFLLEGFNELGAESCLGEQEGWPKQHGLRIVDFQIPEFDLTDFDVTEEAVQ